MRISLIHAGSCSGGGRVGQALGGLALTVLMALAGCGQGQGDAPVEESGRPLRLGGPAAVVSFPLMHMAREGVETGDGRRPARFELWTGADQLRVRLAHGEVDYSAAPANLPALMANRGEPVKLLNVSVWGLLWLVSRDPDVERFTDLRGDELLTPFRRDMGAIALQALFEAQGLEPGRDLELRQTRDALDAVSLMLAGQGRHAVLPEPTASLLLLRSRAGGGAPLHRGQSLEAAWAEAFPEQPELPQAGVMAAAHVADDAALNQAVVAAYAASARWCKAEPADCAGLAHGYLPHMPLAALEESIRVTRLDGLPAAEVRPQLEALYRLILEGQPEAIGGRMPDTVAP